MSRSLVLAMAAGGRFEAVFFSSGDVVTSLCCESPCVEQEGIGVK